MAAAFPAGLAIVVRRPGHEDFVLRDGHTAELSESRRYVRLTSGIDGSTFRVIAIHDEPDRVVVELGDLVSKSGPPIYGDPPEPRGYPLPG
jgi:hypothetical protein